MKKTIMVLIAAFLSACATSSTSAPSEMDVLKKELETLRAENGQLRGNTVADESSDDDLDARAQALKSRLKGRRAPEFVPPARHVAPGLPQHFAWLHRPPEGCESGPLAVEIRNLTDYFLTVILDGHALSVRGADGTLPHIPPGSTAYLCLSETGKHSAVGTAYVSRYGRLTEAERFNSEWQFTGVPPWGMPRHIVRITNGYLATE